MREASAGRWEAAVRRHGRCRRRFARPPLALADAGGGQTGAPVRESRGAGASLESTHRGVRSRSSRLRCPSRVLPPRPGREPNVRPRREPAAHLAVHHQHLTPDRHPCDVSWWPAASRRQHHHQVGHPRGPFAGPRGPERPGSITPARDGLRLAPGLVACSGCLRHLARPGRGVARLEAVGEGAL